MINQPVQSIIIMIIIIINPGISPGQKYRLTDVNFTDTRIMVQCTTYDRKYNRKASDKCWQDTG